jgi:hypothetical protein
VSPPQHEWQQALSRATSPGDVLEIVSTYLQRLEPWELGELPATCKPRAMENIGDLSGYAYDLKRNAGSSAGSAGETLDRITNLMSEAALRLTRLTETRRGLEDDMFVAMQDLRAT